jgi:hypothetical protein
VPRLAVALSAALLAALVGCRDAQTQEASPLKLPAGWTAQPAAGGLLVGPAGAPVGRLQPSSDQAAPLPEPQTLVAAFSRGLPAGAVTRVVRQEIRKHLVLVWLEYQAGAGSPQTVLVGVAMDGGRLLGAASLPGAAEASLEGFAGVLRSLAKD